MKYVGQQILLDAFLQPLKLKLVEGSNQDIQILLKSSPRSSRMFNKSFGGDLASSRNKLCCKQPLPFPLCTVICAFKYQKKDLLY